MMSLLTALAGHGQSPRSANSGFLRPARVTRSRSGSAAKREVHEIDRVIYFRSSGADVRLGHDAAASFLHDETLDDKGMDAVTART